MNIYQYPNLSSAINGKWHYEAHKKKLEEIRSGKAKTKAANFSTLDPRMEESIINISKYKADARSFERKERSLEMEKSNRALHEKLEAIRNGKQNTLKKIITMNSQKSLRGVALKQEQERVTEENIKLIEKLLKPQYRAKELEENYKKVVEYKKVSQKSSKTWGKLTRKKSEDDKLVLPRIPVKPKEPPKEIWKKINAVTKVGGETKAPAVAEPVKSKEEKKKEKVKPEKVEEAKPEKVEEAKPEKVEETKPEEEKKEEEAKPEEKNVEPEDKLTKEEMMNMVYDEDFDSQ